jgi:hypothetical protein
MLRSVVAKALIWAGAWTVATILVKSFRHGGFLREDLTDAFLVGGFLLVLVFALEFYRARRARAAEKSNAA